MLKSVLLICLGFFIFANIAATVGDEVEVLSTEIDPEETDNGGKLVINSVLSGRISDG